MIWPVCRYLVRASFLTAALGFLGCSSDVPPVDLSSCLRADLDAIVNDEAANHQRAESNWIGKAVTVDGRISYISSDRIDVRVASAGFDGVDVTCFVASKYKPKLKELSTGDTVRVWGRISLILGSSIHLEGGGF